MSMKASIKYQIMDFKKGLFWYYILLVLMMAFSCIMGNYTNSFKTNSDGEFIFMTTIFVFIAGLNSFKEIFHMMLQNGISRKTTLISAFLSFLCVAVFMAVIDNILGKIFSYFQNDGFTLSYLYKNLYPIRLDEMGPVVARLENIVIHASVYLGFLSLGYFITMLYYRMNRVVKLFVSIGFPISFILLLNIENSLAIKLGEFLIWTSGIEQQNPYHMVIVFLGLTVLCFTFCWLLIRRAAEKL